MLWRGAAAMATRSASSSSSRHFRDGRARAAYRREQAIALGVRGGESGFAARSALLGLVIGTFLPEQVGMGSSQPWRRGVRHPLDGWLERDARR